MFNLKTYINTLFGDTNSKTVTKLAPIVDQINELEPQYEALSDAELKDKTTEFKQRLAQNETLDDLLPEAFATVREASKRTLQMRHFDVQLVGGIILHQGRITEMKTGEGKTLVSTLTAYLNALEEKGVYIVTVNDYLAKRDSEWMGQIYQFLGISVGLIQNDIEQSDRLHAYQCDITYGTNNEFGFDYLRDNMSWNISECCQTRRHFAIIDEVDSILVDEARTPLIISGPIPDSTAKYLKIIRVCRDLHCDTDFTLDEKQKNAILTETGISNIEKKTHISNIFSTANMDIAHMSVQCIKALHLFKRDVDYVVKEGEVHIVDEFTGRMLEGRRYSDGLHQAIEAKENLVIKEESQTLASITYQNYFRLFPKLSGMTGTAATEEEEFIKIYSLDVVIIPTHKPVIRKDGADVIYKSRAEKYSAIVNEIQDRHKKGQPLLVGTISIEASEHLSTLLKRAGVVHNVLNAKYHEREAEIIANAGQKYGVTIATNMAGRGTDIVLGEGVTDIGGLYVIGTERHESRRIDNQLRGRSGRQGDPGESKFYVSLDDDLMRLFGSERIAKIMDTLGLPPDTPIEHNLISKSISRAQKKVEQYHFSIRKQILDYDDVLDKQRTTIYSLRHDILSKKGLDQRVQEWSQDIVTTYAQFSQYSFSSAVSQSDHESFVRHLLEIFPIPDLSEHINSHHDSPTASHDLAQHLYQFYLNKRQRFPSDIFEDVAKMVLLKTLDSKWMDQLHNMDVLREGIGLRAYGQRNPLVEYKKEAFDMFKDLIFSVSSEALQILNRVEITEQPVQVVPKPTDLAYNNTETSPSTPAIKSTQKIGRNEKVTISKNGVQKNLKWKKAESMIQNDGWDLIQTS